MIYPQIEAMAAKYEKEALFLKLNCNPHNKVRTERRVTYPGYPSTDTGYPSTEPGYPSTDPGYPITESGYPNTEPGYPST